MSRSQVRRPRAHHDYGTDDSGSPILHVDMDAFYALVELRDRPDLIGQPVIVGAPGSRGVVLSATYEARALGVHSAMPMSRARRIAPHAVVLPPHMSNYTQVSTEIMGIFNDVTPHVEPISLDEAFLDVAGAKRLLGTPTQIAELIRTRVAREQGITCSVGIAPNKFVAKLASTAIKPDGQLVIPRDAVVSFVHPLPVSALWGVGERTEEVLHRLGLRTVGDIAHTPLSTLQRALGDAAGTHLAELSWGRDTRPVRARDVEKSISNEHTFRHDVDDPDVIVAQFRDLCDSVGRRLRRAALVAGAVHIKVRFSDFRTITRSRTLTGTTDVSQEIFTQVRGLYAALGLERVRIRLIGVRVDGLMPSSGSAAQLTLGARTFGHREAERAADELHNRFGSAVVRPARLIPDPNRDPSGLS
jgi:DNA polymerase IV